MSTLPLDKGKCALDMHSKFDWSTYRNVHWPRKCCMGIEHVWIFEYALFVGSMINNANTIPDDTGNDDQQATYNH